LSWGFVLVRLQAHFKTENHFGFSDSKRITGDFLKRRDLSDPFFR